FPSPIRLPQDSRDAIPRAAGLPLPEGIVASGLSSTLKQHAPRRDSLKTLTLTGPTPTAPMRTRSMFRNRATISPLLRRLLLTALPAVAAACLASAPASAQQSFDSVAGSWSGSGSMKPSDGPRERVRCKVQYLPKNAGQSVKMDVR